MSITKKQRREARQRFMNKQGKGYNKKLYTRMAWDKITEQEKEQYLSGVSTVNIIDSIHKQQQSDLLMEQIAQDSQ